MGYNQCRINRSMGKLIRPHSISETLTTSGAKAYLGSVHQNITHKPMIRCEQGHKEADIQPRNRHFCPPSLCQPPTTCLHESCMNPFYSPHILINSSAQIPTASPNQLHTREHLWWPDNLATCQLYIGYCNFLIVCSWDVGSK